MVDWINMRTNEIISQLDDLLPESDNCNRYIEYTTKPFTFSFIRSTKTIPENLVNSIVERCVYLKQKHANVLNVHIWGMGRGKWIQPLVNALVDNKIFVACRYSLQSERSSDPKEFERLVKIYNDTYTLYRSSNIVTENDYYELFGNIYDQFDKIESKWFCLGYLTEEQVQNLIQSK